MAILPLLAEPDRYRACDTDLLRDHAAREYWLDLFDSHFDVQLASARACGHSDAQCLEARRAFSGLLQEVRSTFSERRRLDILVLDELRRQALAGSGISDEFRLIKRRENLRAMALLPEWLRRLDQSGAEGELGLILRGMLAGNLFDMGVKETAARFTDGEPSFEEALGRVPPRPWRVDDLDLMAATWRGPARPIRKAVVFADNAGGDVVLGVLPLVRGLLQQGARVVLAANERPSLNDVTKAELDRLVDEAKTVEAAFASPSLTTVSTGTGAPLIDLTHVSQELADAAVGADLLVLVGMGRGIESNWSARFTCAAWRIAMIKDPHIARTMNARMYDAIARFDAGGASGVTGRP